MTCDAQSAGPQIVSRDSHTFQSAFVFIKFQCVVKTHITALVSRWET